MPAQPCAHWNSSSWQAVRCAHQQPLAIISSCLQRRVPRSGLAGLAVQSAPGARHAPQHARAAMFRGNGVFSRQTRSVQCCSRPAPTCAWHAHHMSAWDHMRASCARAACSLRCLNRLCSKPLDLSTPSQWRPGVMPYLLAAARSCRCTTVHAGSKAARMRAAAPVWGRAQPALQPAVCGGLLRSRLVSAAAGTSSAAADAQQQVQGKRRQAARLPAHVAICQPASDP